MCKVGMFASKVNDGGRTYYAYHCPRCGCVITAGEHVGAGDPQAAPTPKRLPKHETK